MGDFKPDAVLDTKGMNCPLPVIKMKRAIEGLQSGQVLAVLATDKGAKEDIPELLKRMGHELLEVREDKEVIEFFIRKK